MSMVDNRVVKMTFDNSDFEKNLKTTMESLSKFEKSLKMDGATAGFDELKKATDKLNMSAIGDKAEKEAKRIDQMSSDAKKSIDGIDDAAENADFSSLSKAANDAVNDVNIAAEHTDFSPASTSAIDAAIDINSAANSVDLSNISESAQEAAESFNALEIVATGVLWGLGEKIASLATNGLSSIGNKIREYTITPIIDGFKEYETQMGSIQTIMANTGMDFSSDADIQTVNNALDELNTYADKTIYNFTEMTRNIGTFTAAGIELQPATKAIQGIANLAALSGSNSQQASTAMYQLSQALSTGTLKLQDWNSVVNAGMGGEVFQEALKRTARAHGIAVDEMIENNGSFRESLQEGWISSEILTETLNQMSISYDKASMSDKRYKEAFEDLISQGYEEKEAKEILRLAKVAEQSATKVRTWSQLWDTVKEAIGSQWSSIWRNFIGDFKQATDTFTFLSNTISKGIDGVLGGIVRTFQIFNSFEDTEGFLGKKGAVYRISETFWGGFARDKDGNEIVDKITGEFVRIKGVFDYLVEAVTKPLGSIKDAFDKVFGMDDYTIFQNLSSLVLAFRDFAQSLIISDNAADGLRRMFEGLFAVIDIGLHVILDLGAAFFGVINVLRIFIDPLIDLALIIGGQLGLAVVWVHDKILELREAFVYMISPISDVISVVKELVFNAFGFSDLKYKIESVRYVILNTLESLWQFLDIPGKMRAIGDFLRSFFSTQEQNVENASGSIQRIKDILSSVARILGSLMSVVGAIIRALGSVVIPIASTLFNVLRSIASILGHGFLIVLGGIVTILSAVGKALSVVAGAISKVVSSGLPVFIDQAGKLASAIGGLISRLWDFFLAWEPIKGIIKIAQDFKTKVVDFFIGIPNKILGAGNSLSGSLGDTEGTIKNMVTWFESLTSAINNLSPEEVMSKLEAGFFKVKYIIAKFVSNLQNINFEKVSGSMISGLQKVKMFAIKTFSDMARYIINAFPSSAGPIRKFFGNVMSISSSAISKLQQIIKNAKENSKSMPEFIGNLIGSISSEIIKGAGKILQSIGTAIATIAISIGIFAKGVGKLIYESIQAILSGEGLDKIAKLWSDFGRELNGIIRKALQKISPSFVEIYDKITGFFSSITGESSGWRVALSTAIDILKEEFKELPEKAKETFGKFKKIVSDAVDKITLKLSNVSGPIGDFFSLIRSRLKQTRKDVKNEGSNIAGSVETTTETIGQKFSNLWKSIKEFFVGTDESKDGGFVGRIVEFFSGKASSLVEKIKDIPKGFGEFLDNIINAFTPERIEKIKNIVLLVTKIKLMQSLRELMSGVGKLSKAFAKRINRKDTQSMNQKLRDIAITFAILAAALWVISTIPDPWKAVGVVTACGVLILVLSGLSSLIQSKFKKSGGKDLLQAAGALAILAIAIRLLLKTVEILTEFDYAANWEGLMALGVFMIAFAGWTRILGSGGKHAIKAAAGLAIMTIALRLLIGPIKSISEFANGLDDEQLGKTRDALAAIGIFILGLSAAMRIAGKHSLSSGAGFILMSLAIDVIAEAIQKLILVSMLNPKAASDAMWGIGLIIAEFAAIAKICSVKEMLAAGAGLLLFSASITIISNAVKKLAELPSANFGNLVATFAGLSALLVIFGVMAKKVEPKNLLATSAALVGFSAAISIMAIALSTLASLDAGSILNAGIAMGIIVGIFAILVGVLSRPALAVGATTVLPMLSLALLALGAACLMIGIALEHTVNAITQLALVSPILSLFVNTIASNVLNFVLASVALGALGAAFAIFGPTAVIAGAGIWLLANGIRDFLTLIIELPVLLPLAGESLSTLFGMLMEKVGELIPLLTTWWTETAWPWLQEKFALLRDWFVNTGLPMLGQWLSGFISKAGEFIGNLHSWWDQNGPTIMAKVGEFIGNLMSKIGEFLPKLGQWVLNEGIPKVKQAISDLIAAAKDYLGPKIEDFVKDIPSKLKSAIDTMEDSLKSIGDNIAQGIADGLSEGIDWIVDAVTSLGESALGAIKNFFGIASPSKLMRDEVGRYIPEGLAVGIKKFSGVVTEASEEMAYDTTNAIEGVLSSNNYDIPSPSISPVMNMSDATNDISNYNRMLRNTMLDGNITATNKFNGEMSMSADLASKLDADMNSIDSLNSTMYDIQQMLHNNMITTENLNNKTNAILETLGGDASAIRNSLSSGLGLYLDKSTLVGAIAPEMDSILGKRALLAGRGVY